MSLISTSRTTSKDYALFKCFYFFLPEPNKIFPVWKELQDYIPSLTLMQLFSLERSANFVFSLRKSRRHYSPEFGEFGGTNSHIATAYKIIAP